MKKIVFLLCLVLGMSATLTAQEDLENIVSDDIEIEGLENFWIETQLEYPDAVEGLRPARPKGGVVPFLTHVQKCVSKLIVVLFDKYPSEMLGMLGTQADIYIDFVVTEKGEIELEGITNGAIFGVNTIVARKIFETYRSWKPAKREGDPESYRLTLKIDISI